MTKKPSEWSPRETWEQFRAKALSVMDSCGYVSKEQIESLLFPGDMPGRVTDEILQQMIDSSAHNTPLAALIELQERRAKDKA